MDQKGDTNARCQDGKAKKYLDFGSEYPGFRRFGQRFRFDMIHERAVANDVNFQLQCEGTVLPATCI